MASLHLQRLQISVAASQRALPLRARVSHEEQGCKRVGMQKLIQGSREQSGTDRSVRCSSKGSLLSVTSHDTRLQARTLSSVAPVAGDAIETNVESEVREEALPLVKVCGVVCPEDATMAGELGADLVGMILWPHAKRSIAFGLASEISAAARAGGALPVGVFVDESAEDIVAACAASQVAFAQLHGDKAREALLDLPLELLVIYVLQADKHGVIQTPLPPRRKDGTAVDWILVDGMQGGSGEKVDWANLLVPSGASKHGWLLAGGLGPGNVAEAISILNPDGVDVSSGVILSDKLRKDKEKVRAFVTAAKSMALEEQVQ